MPPSATITGPRSRRCRKAASHTCDFAFDTGGNRVSPGALSSQIDALPAVWLRRPAPPKPVSSCVDRSEKTAVYFRCDKELLGGVGRS